MGYSRGFLFFSDLKETMMKAIWRKKNELELVINEVKKAVVGKDEHIKKILACILARGHVLLEDIPGVGKTNLTLAFSKALSLDFHRMQFTSDVLPGNVTGFIIYN